MMDPVERFSIGISANMARELCASIEAGEFSLTSEAVRCALRAWRRLCGEDVDRAEAMRERIRRSIDDPRPNLTAEDVDAQLAALFARAEGAGGRATS